MFTSAIIICFDHAGRHGSGERSDESMAVSISVFLGVYIAQVHKLIAGG
jgi:hypothetical protein